MWESAHKKGWVLKNWFFPTLVLEKSLESPLDCKEIKPVYPKEINPEYSLKELMLKLQYFGHLMLRVSSLEKKLMLGKIEGKWRRGLQRMRWWDSITNSIDMNLSKSGRQWRTEEPGMLQSMGLQRVGHDLMTEQQQSHNHILLWNQKC